MQESLTAHKKLLILFAPFTMVILLLITQIQLTATDAQHPSSSVVPHKKKIVVLCCNGGFGHKAAAATLVSLFKEQYDFSIIYPIEELQLMWQSSATDMYDQALRHGWIRSVNLISKHVAPKVLRSKKRKLENLVSRHLINEKADFLISLIPFVNYPASEAARKQNIPFLLITTDNDLSNWVHGLQGVEHPNFRVTIGYDQPETRGLLKERRLSDLSIDTIGLPLRPEFCKTYEQEALLKAYEIPPHKPVVLIMMGGAGGVKAFEYAKTLTSSNLGIHVIAITGKNEAIAKKIRALPVENGNSLSAIGFTDKVAELMAISDLIITKPGPGTINEALAMNLPLLLDTTVRPLSWEKANIDIVTKNGVGEVLKENSDVILVTKKYLQDSSLRERVLQGFASLPKNQFHSKIPQIIEEMSNYQKFLDLKKSVTKTSDTIYEN